MLRIPFFASFSGPDLGRWIAAGVAGGASWVADSVAGTGGDGAATLEVPWSWVALFALSLAVVASGMAIRSRVRQRRVERELEEQLRLGMHAAQRRATRRPRPLLVPRRPSPAPAEAPRVEPLPPFHPVAEQSLEPEVAPEQAPEVAPGAAPARHREEPSVAEDEPVEAQAVLIDRIVKDAWGLALGGGVLPQKAPARPEPRPSPPPAPAPVVATPKQTIEAPPRPRAKRRPRTTPARPSPPMQENPPDSEVTLRMPAPKPVRLLAPGLPASRPVPVRADPPARPDGFESALADAWGHAIEDEAAPAPPARPRTTAVAPQPPLSRFAHPLRASGVATSVNEYLRLCESLLAKDRGEEAARLAREGLALHPGESLILSMLSRAEERAGRLDAALAAAVAAHRAKPSRTSLTEILRIATAARRFRPEDGERLRRAVARRPSEPVLLRAAGVFEAMHGNRWAAIGLLRTALGLESDEAVRSQIASELSRLEAFASGDGAE